MEIHIDKVAIPRLPRQEPKHRRKLKTEEEKKELKRQRDRRRTRTRVNIGSSYESWRDLRDRLGYSLDSDLAVLLLDSFKKLTEVSSPQTTELTMSSPYVSTASQSEHCCDEGPKLTTTSSTSRRLQAKCPSCGFVLSQWCFQNTNSKEPKEPKEVPQTQSVEVTLALVSGADGESDISEEEEESEGSGPDEQNIGENSDEDWIPPPHQTPRHKSTETQAAEEEEEEEEEKEGSEGSGVSDDWIPHRTRTRTKKRTKRCAAVKQESGESARAPGKRKLCPECGVFYQKLPHECEHKTKPFTCNICGKRCVSESSLKIHNRIHSDTYEHACKHCYASFRTRVEKVAHELVHQEQEDPYRCRECEQSFPTFKERRQHIKRHRDGTAFTCMVCGITFRQRSCFLRHAVVHTGERAFRCPTCGRSFNQKGHLESHMRLHTGERPYTCRRCGQSFNHNVSLKSHAQRCHPTGREEEGRGVWSEAGAADGGEEEEQATAEGKCKKSRTGQPRGRPKRKHPNMTDSDGGE